MDHWLLLAQDEERILALLQIMRVCALSGVGAIPVGNPGAFQGKRPGDSHQGLQFLALLWGRATWARERFVGQARSHCDLRWAGVWAEKAELHRFLACLRRSSSGLALRQVWGRACAVPRDRSNPRTTSGHSEINLAQICNQSEHHVKAI